MFPSLDISNSALIVVDVQEKLFPHIDQYKQLEQKLCLSILAMQQLDLPVIVTEQYPKGLGKTIKSVAKSCSNAIHFEKTDFSCVQDAAFATWVEQSSIKQYILVGIEAHVCILQTVKDFIALDKEVIVLADAVGSRSPIDYQLAIDAFRHNQVRVTSIETLIFEALKSSKSKLFTKIMQLLKEYQAG